MSGFALGVTTEAQIVRALCDVGHALTAVDDWEERVGLVLDRLSLLVPADLAVLLLDVTESVRLVRRRTPEAGALLGPAVANVREHYRLLTAQEAETAPVRLITLDQWGEVPAGEGETGLPPASEASYLSLPLMGPEEILGIIHIASLKEQAYGVDDLRVFSVFAAQLGSYLAHVVLHAHWGSAGERSLAEIAHEVRNPLASATGFTQLLRRRLASAGGAEHAQEIELATRVESQLQRIKQMADSLLMSPRVRGASMSLDRRSLDLVALCQRVVEMVQVTTEQHTFAVKADGGCVVLGDAARLEQVLLNLVGNAIKYSPEGGPVELRLARDEGARQVVVAVVDRGIGIAPEEQNQIFRRYYRADTATGRRVGGTGLGLYISSEIVRRHGGELRVASEPGKGSTFYFSLPVGE